MFESIGKIGVYFIGFILVVSGLIFAEKFLSSFFAPAVSLQACAEKTDKNVGSDRVPLDIYGNEMHNIIMIPNLYFAFLSDELSNEARNELDTTRCDLVNDPRIMGIEVAGHTDSRGSANDNQRLSIRRANTVANYLGDQGVDANIIQVIGHGESRPIASNDTEDGRAENNRVEINVNVDYSQN